MKSFPRIYFSIYFIIPDSVFAFTSGILLSAAINIATSQLPHSIWKELSSATILAMFLMFASCVFFFWLSVSVKPHQDIHSRVCEEDDFTARSKDWMSYLVGKKVKIKWSVLFGLSVSTALASLILVIV